MASDGRYKTFDDRPTDTFERGYVVVLKPLEQAIEDGDPILAVVKDGAQSRWEDERSYGTQWFESAKSDSPGTSRRKLDPKISITSKPTERARR